MTVAARSNAQIWRHAGLARTVPLASLQKIEALDHDKLKEGTFFNFVSKWAQENPQEALSAAFDLSANQGVETSTINDAFRQAAFGMLWEDLNAIHENNHKFPKDTRHGLVGPVVKQWRKKAPAAAEWAAEHIRDSPEYNLAMSSVTFYYGRWVPETGIVGANKLTYNDIKGNSICSSLKQLNFENLDRALVVAENSNLLAENIKQSFIRWLNEYKDSQHICLIPSDF